MNLITIKQSFCYGSLPRFVTFLYVTLYTQIALFVASIENSFELRFQRQLNNWSTP